jgi:serpin B
MRTTIGILSSALILTLAGGSLAAVAGDPSPTPPGAPRASADPTDARAAGDALTGFGLDLYRAIAPEHTNLVLSPTSIALALGLARAGARGDTAAEMDAVMREVASDAHAGWLNALDQALAERSGTFTDDAGQELPVALRIANAPFVQDGLALEPAYVDALAERFGADVQRVDFRTRTEEARGTINGWVDERTEGRIEELIAEGILTPDSRLALVNAIYLKAPWQSPFTTERTEDGAFTRADGSTVDVPFMRMTESFGYAAGDGWQAVELPYLGGSLALTVIVPEDLAAVRRTLTPEAFADLVADLEPTMVQLALPRFGIETQAELATLLADLGMPTAFGDRADFTGITGDEPLAISNVIHQANMDVDEKGTEAAAATAVVIRATGMPGEPVEVRADRPFLFALRDVPTGAVLFLGHVGDPSVR